MKSNRGFCCFSLPSAPARVAAWRRFQSVYLSLHFGRDPTGGRFALFRCRRYRRESQLAALLVGAFLFLTLAEAQPEDIFPSSAALAAWRRFPSAVPLFSSVQTLQSVASKGARAPGGQGCARQREEQNQAAPATSCARRHAPSAYCSRPPFNSRSAARRPKAAPSQAFNGVLRHFLHLHFHFGSIVN